MRRSRKGAGWSPAGGLSLFPFLAVLICVMGGLIVLLVVLARHARVQAIRTAQAAASQKKVSLEDIHQQRELLQWQAEQIRESRAKTEAQLAEARLQLGGAEDHLRKLRQELEQLQRAWQALEQSVHRTADLGQLEDRLRQLQAEILRTKHLAAQKTQAEQLPQVFYAIIPYQGPHGTQRRPIYIECRQEAIILQPEGIVLPPRDFEGPLTQENPLARAIRAVREYWATQAGSLSEAQEPYPLLLVRPDGIVAYYTAREALAEWGSEFGYELIGQDWQLKFPPADPQLAQILREEVQLARARQEVLAKIAPRVAGRSRPLYRVGPRGIQLEDSGDAGGGGGGSGRPGTARFADTNRSQKTLSLPGDAFSSQGSPPGRAGSGDGLGQGPGSGLAAEGTSRSRTRTPLADHAAPTSRSGASEGLGTSGSGHPGPEGQAGGSSEGLEGGFGLGSSSGQGSPAAGGGPGAFGDASASSESMRVGMGNIRTGMGQPGGSAGGFAGPSSPAGPGGLSGGQMGSGSFGSMPPATPDASNAGNGLSATRQWIGGVPTPEGRQTAEQPEAFSGRATPRRRPGEWYDPPPKLSASADSPGEPGSRNSGMQKPPVGSAKELRSLRGRNWALPESADKAIPITRPIPAECYPDRLVLAPGTPEQKEIPFRSKTVDSLDELVGAVWEQIERWGIAGRGMYWRPVLSVRVAPGAEDRFQDLQTLLEDSGLLIERKR
jgi:hypothetical protein